jgi:superfamily II DNA or RNA helicase
MYLYVASCPYYLQLNFYKLGCTSEPHGRLTTYLTGCPPEPQYEIQYYGLWKTKAKTMKDLLYYETCLHEKFNQFRMKQSEWFQFEQITLQQIREYLNHCRFVICETEFSQIQKPKKSILQTNYYSKNTERFIEDNSLKNKVLDAIQTPAIQTLIQFIKSDELAGQLIAPCGSGKTNMTCKAIQDLKRVVICVPSLRIQEQWGNAVRKDCLFLGGDADDWVSIEQVLKTDSFCIITTYMSCKHLIEILPETTELIVFDEAHHMTGLVSENNQNGQGITRALLKSLVDKRMKRLFLTFTPKDFDCDDDMIVMSMNDETIFGKQIVEIKLRDLINQGVLPDYIIWALSSEGVGIQAKMEQILLAWNSTQINHLIVFVEDLVDKDIVKEYLKDKVDCPVLSIDRSQDTKRVIDEFQVERAILIDCRRLGEGVDIPIADSVAILYPKQSVVDIVQMVLRAGRWYEYKSVFHILLPHVTDEDMSGIQNVILALAKYDEALRGEVMFSVSSKKKGYDELYDKDVGKTSDGRIQYDMISSTDIEKMHECFGKIRTLLIPKSNKKEIQKLCHSKNIKDSKEYELLRSEFPHLPEDPRFTGTTWFDFLNPSVEKIDLKMFVNTVVENKKKLPTEYIYWHQQRNYPSLQNIRDGYFGDQTNFLEIIEKFAPVERRRR